MVNGIYANKQLGQHFLVDQEVITKIVDAIAPKSSQSLVEIGPGLGALTLPVLARCGTLTVIEYDRNLVPTLRCKARNLGTIHVIEADVLTVNFSTFSNKLPLRIFGNLPYNVSTPILFHCLKFQHLIADAHFMLQKEVVERMVATPGRKNYGRLSVMLQRYFSMEYLLDVAPESFQPPPKVESAVVRMLPYARPKYHILSENDWELIVKSSFLQRRKMLRKSLEKWFNSDELLSLDIDPTTRAERLSGEDFARLANALTQKQIQ